MNTFESTLTAVLRDEAQELTMTIDQNRAAEVLHSRLDDVDSSRRRWYVGLATGVAAVVALVVVLGVVARPAADAPPANPGPSATAPGERSTYTTSEFRVPFSLVLPAWIASARAVTSESQDHVTWSVCVSSSCTRQSVARFHWITAPTETTSGTLMPGYDGYLAYLRDREAAGDLAVGEVSTTEVGGRRTTIMTIVPSATFAGTLGCETGGWSTDDCWNPVPSVPLRLAVIDQGDFPVLMHLDVPPGEARADAEAQFDAAVGSLRFAASPADGIVGRWTASFTRAQVSDLLTSAGLASTIPRVLQEFPGTGEPLTWELWADGASYELFRTDGSGVEQYDFQRYVLDGRRLTTDPQNSDRTRVVFDVTRDDAALAFVLVSDGTADLAPGVPDEAIQRALYSTATWTRMS
jgi:hypothetical protein